jgi:hypothetical protein
MEKAISIAALALAGTLAAGAVLAGDARDVRKTLPLDADGTLSVETYKGSITVTAANGAEASIEARIVPDGDDEASLRRAEQTEVTIDGGGRSISVRTDEPPGRRRGHGGWFGLGDDGSAAMVHYTIRMPRSARLHVEDYKSATRVSGLTSDLRLQTYKGTADVSGQNGEVDLDTYKGEVTISFAALAKPVRLQTYKGEIRLRLPASSAFEVDADTGRRGDFETQFEMTTRSGGSSRRIRGLVNGGGPMISFETDKGSLTLAKE